MRGLRGVVVTNLAVESLANEHLQQGDLIFAVNNSRISGAGEFFLHLAASAAVQDTNLHLLRDGKTLRLTVPALPRRE